MLPPHMQPPIAPQYGSIPPLPLPYPTTTERRGTKRTRADDDPDGEGDDHTTGLSLSSILPETSHANEPQPTSMLLTGQSDPTTATTTTTTSHHHHPHSHAHPHSQQPQTQPHHQSATPHDYRPPSIHQHHHHRLPSQAALAGTGGGAGGLGGGVGVGGQRGGTEATSSGESNPPTLVGQHGMPAPAPHPKAAKSKFTPENDALLVHLKEKKDLTWKQIADFFPGRTSGTLQVRYCTKLRAKATVWTDETV